MKNTFENGCLVKDESRGGFLYLPPFKRAGFFISSLFKRVLLRTGCLVRMKAGAVIFEQSHVLLAQSIAPV